MAAPGGVSPPVFSYSYLQNSNLLASVIGPVHTVTNTWELDRDVLDAKENKVGGVTVSKLDYAVNAIGQRTALSQTGTAFASVRGIAWSYDTYGQVTSADSTLATQDRAYQYDAIGNRKKSANSLTLPVTDNYISNSLNQYSTINNPQSSLINPSYDLDGNATAYPLPTAPTVNSTLTYDAENRLTSTTVGGTTTTQQFDATGRRISKTTGTNTKLYLYDGWNVIAEYSSSTLPTLTSTLLKTRLWGPDLSGTAQGAGGVGGLLSESNISNPRSPISYPTYDGNGNISEYLTTTGAIAAHFEYDAFGNTTVNTDTGNQFTYKFSTKPQDVETGLYYYGYRYYDAIAGRWINRDPIEEKGGVNLHGFVANNGVSKWDLLGLYTPPIPIDCPGPKVAARFGAVAAMIMISELAVDGIMSSMDSVCQPGCKESEKVACVTCCGSYSKSAIVTGGAGAVAANAACIGYGPWALAACLAYSDYQYYKLTKSIDGSWSKYVGNCLK